jgi:CubicO group peptidase (beta-lactamase class C family)
MTFAEQGNTMDKIRWLSSLLVLLVLLLPSRGLAGPDNFSAVNDYLRAEMRELQIPGLAVVVVAGDQVVYTQGLGVADPAGRAVTPQTPMLLGSTSKGFTALAVMQLVEAGKVDLDALVVHYLPWFRLAGGPPGAPADAWTQITVRQLLYHTSGIPEYAGANVWMSRYAGDDALEQEVRSYADVAPDHAPGESFEYSNANYQILGLIVQSVSGQTYEAYVEEHIFRPLDMRHSYAVAAEAPDLATGYRYWFGRPFPAAHLPVPRALAPAATLVSTAEDMGHYLIAQMNGGRYGGVQVLSAQGMAELHRPGIAIDGSSSYAMGWVVGPDGAVSHNGETPSFTSGLRIAGDWGVFAVRNIAANQREQRLEEIAPGVLSVVRGEMPVQNTLNPAFRRTMVELGGLLALLLGGVGWSVRRLVRWVRRPERAPQRIVPVLLRVVLPLLVNLALAALLWYMGPISGHRSFAVLAQGAPDQLLLLGTDVGLALVGAALQVGSALWLWNHRGRDGDAASAATCRRQGKAFIVEETKQGGHP